MSKVKLFSLSSSVHLISDLLLQQCVETPSSDSWISTKVLLFMGDSKLVFFGRKDCMNRKLLLHNFADFNLNVVKY